MVQMLHQGMEFPREAVGNPATDRLIIVCLGHQVRIPLGHPQIRASLGLYSAKNRQWPQLAHHVPLRRVQEHLYPPVTESHSWNGSVPAADSRISVCRAYWNPLGEQHLEIREHHDLDSGPANSESGVQALRWMVCPSVY